MSTCSTVRTVGLSTVTETESSAIAVATVTVVTARQSSGSGFSRVVLLVWIAISDTPVDLRPHVEEF